MGNRKKGNKMIEKNFVGLSKDKTKRVYAIVKSKNCESEIIDVVTEDIQ